jgi:hypothetical protein
VGGTREGEIEVGLCTADGRLVFYLAVGGVGCFWGYGGVSYGYMTLWFFLCCIDTEVVSVVIGGIGYGVPFNLGAHLGLTRVVYSMDIYQIHLTQQANIGFGMCN